jgi:hypothetical protein
MDLNIIKAVCDMDTTNVILKCKMLKYFPLQLGKRIDAPSLLYLEVPVQESRPEKELKTIQLEKE